MKKASMWIVLVIVICSCLSCEERAKRRTLEMTRTVLLREAFNAIKDNDWKAYSELLITSADLDAQQDKKDSIQHNETPMGNSYANLDEEQRIGFDDAVAGGEGLIDFKNSRFVSLGSVVDSGIERSVTGAKLPYITYSLKIGTDRGIIDTENLDPAFVVVRWKKEYRLMALGFMEPEEFETQGEKPIKIDRAADNPQ